MEEVEQGKIPKVNKKASAGIFWANMLLLMVSLGYIIPRVVNKMIRHDVEEDVKARRSNTTTFTKPLRMKDFIKP